MTTLGLAGPTNWPDDFRNWDWPMCPFSWTRWTRQSPKSFTPGSGPGPRPCRSGNGPAADRGAGRVGCRPGERRAYGPGQDHVYPGINSDEHRGNSREGRGSGSERDETVSHPGRGRWSPLPFDEPRPGESNIWSTGPPGVFRLSSSTWLRAGT